ncbi:MAG: methyltransferase domain-containing protein [Candidatus Dormibacteraeota bacterium]|nr:methyltransferase domain-containing protein [Candidatus Dormibacteraeota bacterium]
MGTPIGDSDHYLFPRHVSEVDRLDIQHYALREVLQGNHLAPLAAPERILDVGSGSGQWGWEMAREFPGALVIGLDLVPGKPSRPNGYRATRGNLLQGLPFADGQFDFVHQRFLLSGIPVTKWPGVVRDLVRVAKPGGWVELVELPNMVDGAGPATVRLHELTGELARTLGLDEQDRVFRSLDQYLRDAGLSEVARKEVALPIGRAGGRVGELMLTDFRATFTRISEVCVARGITSEEEAHHAITDALRECDERRQALPVAIAYGRKHEH